MVEIINKLDDMVRNMDYHNWSPDYEVYGGLTFGDIVKIESALIEHAGLNKLEYYIGVILYDI